LHIYVDYAIYKILTIIKTTRLSVAEVDVADWAWSRHA